MPYYYAWLLLIPVVYVVFYAIMSKSFRTWILGRIGLQEKHNYDPYELKKRRRSNDESKTEQKEDMS